MSGCRLCPKNCGANRAVSAGWCGAGDKIKIARAYVHKWEEPCICGGEGSGTVFFSGCNLKCVFCQNKAISHGGAGRDISMERLCDIFFELKRKGASNINLVTADCYIPKIIPAIARCKEKDINLPFVFNTSSYLKGDSVDMLDGLIDIYLPDLKYMDEKLSYKYSLASDYPRYAVSAIDKMVAQRGKPRFDSDGNMKSGVLIRHLVLPGNVLNSKKVIRHIYNSYGDDVYISIMNQYTPFGNLEKFPEINRRVSDDEYKRVVDFALSIGVKNAYIQDGEASCESFIPEFDLRGV